MKMLDTFPGTSSIFETIETMSQTSTRITREQAAASLELYRPPAKPLMEVDALQFLALLRALCKSYGVDKSWGRAYCQAVLGRPPLAKNSALPESVEDAAAIGERLVDNPAENLRGLLIGVERGMHRRAAE